MLKNSSNVGIFSMMMKSKNNIFNKAILDQYYSCYAKTPSITEKDLFNAGFFDDLLLKKLEPDDYWYPLNTDNFKFSSNKKNAVLVTTGSFAPFHSGHYNMMLLSKIQLEELGFNVSGSVISPSHDIYVNAKLNIKKSLPSTIEKRIQSIYDCIFEIDKNFVYTVDTWEAIALNNAINFSDVLLRVEYYFKSIGKNVEIFYVFGSDNKDFKNAFLEKGNCVNVLRKLE